MWRAWGRDKFDGVSDRVTRQELKALFDVIGTPSWVDAENVPTPAWRNYLQVSSPPAALCSAPTSWLCASGK